MGDLVTIVIPAYNAEQFLRENVESIINQSYMNLEIIYVCDGCSDQTVEILQEYAKKDNRINIVVQREKHGAAFSRNVGMNKANGDWIIFFDADDLFEKNMIEELLISAKENKAQVSMCYIDLFELEVSLELNVDSTKKKIFCEKYPLILGKENRKYIFQLIDTSPCTKLVHKSIYKNPNVIFQEILNANDMYYSAVVATMAEKIIYVDKKMLHYRGNIGRKTLTTDRVKKKNCLWEACDKIYSYLLKLDNSYDFLISFYNMIFSQLLSYHNKPVFDMIINEFKNVYLKKWEIHKNINRLCYLNKEIYQNIMIDVWKNPKEIILDAKIKYLKDLSLNNQFSLWGCGKNGVELIARLQKIGILFQHLYDSKASDKEMYFGDIKVEKFQRNYNDVIVVTTTKYFYDIKKMSKGKVKEIVDLESSIEMVI